MNQINKIEKLAILGGKKTLNEELPLYNTIGKEEKNAVMKVLDSGVLSGFAAQPNKEFEGGYIIENFQENFSKLFDVKYSIAVNSATSALHAALAALELGPGDEVIVPCYTMSATASSVLYTGAIPIFSDIDSDTFCIDINSVKNNINERTKAIITVNLYGHPSDLPNLRRLCDEKNIFLIEDNAQAPLATIDGKKTGSFGDLSIYSLNRHKTMQCGEGGVVTTNNPELALKVKLIRNHGELLVDRMGIKNIVNIVGMNYRMTNMECAVANEQIKKLKYLTEYRQELACYMDQEVNKVSFLQKPKVLSNCTHVYYFYSMKYSKNKLPISRELFEKAMIHEGMQIKASYDPPIYLQSLYQKKIGFGKEGYPFNQNKNYKNLNYSPGLCPNAERIQNEELIWTQMCRPPLNKKHIDLFIKACLKIQDNVEALLNYDKKLSE